MNREVHSNGSVVSDRKPPDLKAFHPSERSEIIHFFRCRLEKDRHVSVSDLKVVGGDEESLDCVASFIKIKAAEIRAREIEATVKKEPLLNHRGKKIPLHKVRLERQKIIKENHGNIIIAELARHFEVSESTYRRFEKEYFEKKY